MSRKTNNSEFIPVFQMAFLKPQYWGHWLAIGAIAMMACLPAAWRDPILGQLGKRVGRLAKSARQRARANLFYCLPHLNYAQREAIIDQMFATAPQSIVMMAELVIRSPSKVNRRIQWHGKHLIDKLAKQDRNLIFLVPHGWAVDIPAMVLAAEGHPMAAMFHNQKNQLMDYIWNKLRRHFGGRMHARNAGIKPFISSIRQGYWGYYLPDQDHGVEHSEFVDFFATYKATLPAIGRLKKVCRAEVIPLFPVYDSQTHQLTIVVLPAMQGLDQADDKQLARMMNEKVEQLVGPNPEQYTWILKLLRTRKPGDADPYDETGFGQSKE